MTRISVDGAAMIEGQTTLRVIKDCPAMRLSFDGEIHYWRGPAPWYFVTVPEDDSRRLSEAASLVTYGWGMIPVTARIGGSAWTTSLFPKDGRYLVPVRAAIRKAESLDDGDAVTVELLIDAD